ncbi:hypothetical protein FH972_024120 [Carpinus fangiana]|uniref:Uncharacterized protein n=1 Tax=Carpinus fangiana TaxID=176857 RepID=A0A5N6KXT3_9ROSI|nr:hypothetical protein FH972_024120 [Carpinus fangiana]
MPPNTIDPSLFPRSLFEQQHAADTAAQDVPLSLLPTHSLASSSSAAAAAASAESADHSADGHHHSSHFHQSPSISGSDDFDSSDQDADFLQGLDPLAAQDHMNRKSRARASKAHRSSNGDAQSGDMAADIGHRRKFNKAENGETEHQRERLMHNETFSLDEDPALLDDRHDSDKSIGFWDLPVKDRKNFLVLVLLYFLQGIPMGLATGSVPFLLKSHLSYGQIGIFSLASYPYSLKLLWSPIVDAVWSPRVGRRKSWILPVQAFSGVSMIWLGSRVNEMMDAAGANGGAGVWTFTWWWFFLVFTCATQDIAVDGWALTLLSQKHLSYASTAQTVGLTGGQFLSYTVFLAFNSPNFANRWFRATPSDEGVMTLSGYLIFWGWMYLLVTAGLAVLKKEDKTKDRDSIGEVYKVMGGILKLRNVQLIIIIHLIAKIGFQANDGVTSLKLLEKGFSQEDLALTVLIDFPFELGLGYYAGKWSSTYPPMQLWCWAFVGRLAAAAFAQFTVMVFPASGVTTPYLLLVICEHVMSTFMSTVMFVASAAFHAKIADPVIGGTYMTMLATVSNLGGTFPRFFVLKMVDAFTVATCTPPSTPPKTLKEGVSPVTTPFDCVLEVDKHRCIDGGGVCTTNRDGYYYVNVLCIIIGVVTFFSFIKPKALQLQALPLKAWRLAGFSG